MFLVFSASIDPAQKPSACPKEGRVTCWPFLGIDLINTSFLELDGNDQRSLSGKTSPGISHVVEKVLQSAVLGPGASN